MIWCALKIYLNKKNNSSFQVDEKNNDMIPLLLDFWCMMSKYAHKILNIKFFLWFCPKLKFEGNQFVYGLTITIVKLSQVRQDRKIILATLHTLIPIVWWINENNNNLYALLFWCKLNTWNLNASKLKKKFNSRDQMFDSQLMHTNKSFQEKNMNHFYLGIHKNSLPSK